MTSEIDPLEPANAFTARQGVRRNFAAARAEILQLQAAVAALTADLPPGFIPGSIWDTVSGSGGGPASNYVTQTQLEIVTNEITDRLTQTEDVANEAQLKALDLFNNVVPELQTQQDDFSYTLNLLQTPPVQHVIGNTGEPAYLTGFSRFPSPDTDVTFTKDSQGMVIFGGFCQTSLTGGVHYAMQLPVGFRPIKAIICVGLQNDIAKRFHIQQDGNVLVVDPITTWLAFPPTTFYAA
jgi:hypothetical protein